MDIVRHFVSAGYSRSGIYNTLSLLEKKSESVERKLGSSRPTVLRDCKVQQKLKRKTEGKVASSFHALGREVGATGQTVKKYLDKMDIAEASVDAGRA